MSDESPDQIRQRVLADELAKGSDPRVAEGRSKAAEMRARHDLPIDPESAWRALAEREGRGVSTATAESQQTVVERPAAGGAAQEAPPVTAPEPASQEPEIVAAGTAPSAAPALPLDVEVEVESATQPSAPEIAEVLDSALELGDVVSEDLTDLGEIAGIKVRDARSPTWLVATILAITLASVLYLLVFSGADVGERATGCRVDQAGQLVCSIE